LCEDRQFAPLGQPALARRLQARRGHPLFDPGGGLGLPRLAQKPFALAHALSSGRFRPHGRLRQDDLLTTGVFDLAIWHGTLRGPCTTPSKYLASGSGQQRNKLVSRWGPRPIGEMLQRGRRCCSLRQEEEPSGQFGGFFFECAAARPFFFGAAALRGMSSNIDAIGTPRIWQISYSRAALIRLAPFSYF
jgi:hypothetical protein